MKFSQLKVLIAFTLCSCSGVPIQIKPDGSMTGGPMSLLGCQSIQKMEVKTPNGGSFLLEGYNTQNPDPDLTNAAKNYLVTREVTGMIKDVIPKTVVNPNKIPKDPNVIPKDPNVIPKDPNVIPVDPNLTTTP